MAVQHTAQVVQGHALNGSAALLELELPSDSPVQYRGGQYIIVDTGVPLGGGADSGKTVKRAYSLLSADTQAKQMTLAVQRVGDGPGSNYMNALQPGARITFSGPWGKWTVQEEDEPPALVIATDTGITAALGLVRSAAFHRLLDSAQLVWCFAEPDAFVPPDLVQSLVPAQCAGFRTERIAPVGASRRAESVRAVVEAALQNGLPRTAYLVGDGDVVHGLKDWLVDAGLPETHVRTEYFFNNPAKRSAT